MADKLKLYCLLDGETPSRAMPIRFDSTDSGGDLKELLRAKKTPRFDDIAADELILWQVSIPVTDDEDDSPVFLGDLKEKKKVFPTKLLSDLFGEPPKDTIHVIVQKPSSGSTHSVEYNHAEGDSQDKVKTRVVLDHRCQHRNPG
ncbi:hypothetical protein BGZ72_000129 [Mortierella alpina]|nr:hypothetical protein BGZ72_000129 [Mortierella alpina]